MTALATGRRVRLQRLTWTPRDVPAAARAASTLLVGAGVITCLKCVGALLLFGTIKGDGSTATMTQTVVNTWVIPAVLVGLGLWVPRLGPRATVWLGWPLTLLAILLIGLINVSNHEASSGSQMFVVLPVVYAAYHLQGMAAGVVTAAAAAVTVFCTAVIRPDGLAGSSIAYFLVALVAMAAMISRARGAAAATERELETMATRDSLTGLSTRLVFDTAITMHLARPTRDGLALAVIDVDRFKAINDVYGHPGGDQALVRVSDHLRNHGRPGDTLCRLGGDEFVLLMPECDAHTAARRVAALVDGARELPGVPAFTLSAGIAHAPTDAEDARGLFAAADQRLYAAKAAGRDRFIDGED